MSSGFLWRTGKNLVRHRLHRRTGRWPAGFAPEHAGEAGLPALARSVVSLVGMKSVSIAPHDETPPTASDWLVFDVGLPYRREVAPADGYTTLARAVIKKALADTAPGMPQRTRDEALLFLSGGPALSWWCALAGVEPEAIRASTLCCPEPSIETTAPAGT